MRRWSVLVLVMLLVACSRGDAPAPSKPTEAPKPTADAKPTATTLPSDAAGVVQLFKAKGLPIGETTVYSGDNDPNKLLGRPNQYTGKANWLDTRLPRETTDKIESTDGGTVETFANEADAKARQAYVAGITSKASMFAEYAYLQGNVLVRLSKRLTPDQAGQYEALLKNPSVALTPVPAVAQQAPPTAAPAPPAAEKPAASAQRVRVTGAGADGVNMRAEPSTTAARVKLLRDGAQLEIVGEDRQTDGRTWRNVKDVSDGATGWVAADFTTAAPTDSPPPAPAVEKPSAPPEVAPKPAASTAMPKVAVPPAKPSGGTTCSSYPSQAAAQAAYRANPVGLRSMDSDGDGVACESNPGPRDTAPVRR